MHDDKNVEESMGRRRTTSCGQISCKGNEEEPLEEQ
jgi:hypothetical protein